MNYLHDDGGGDRIEESAWCAVPWNEGTRVPVYLMVMSTVVAFIIPITLVAVLYFQ